MLVNKMTTIFNKNLTGKNKIKIPDIEEIHEINIPKNLLNNRIDLLDVNETEVVRHYTALSKMNFGVDDGMYPLGSCTMKYNPKLNESIASDEKFTNIHPLSDASQSQGALEVMYGLEKYLCTITGMSAFALSPAAGAHGELTGVMVIKKYFENKKENRDTILIPDSAHGTNPASVAMCGFKVQEIPSTDSGNVDIKKLKSMLDKNVAAMMLTSPNTLGLFDENILEISKLLRDNGSLFYGDGANLNAILGKAKMRDMGFDLMHTNLHKTFSTPHGGGGPGAGPLGVSKELVQFLPVPVVEKNNKGYFLNYDKKNSIGAIHSFYGNFLVALKSYIYITLLGSEGLREVSETAVLNANYLKEKLKDAYNLPIDRVCMHEFVLNDENLENHVTTNDVAKRLLDYHFHAPTVYFPLLVHGAMMIEPTETESKESLDNFIEVMLKIRQEIKNSPELVLGAPNNTPVKKVDAVGAARKPILKC